MNCVNYVSNLLLSLHLLLLSLETALERKHEFFLVRGDEDLLADVEDFMLITSWMEEVVTGTVTRPCNQVRAAWARSSSSLPSGILELKGSRSLGRLVRASEILRQKYRQAGFAASSYMWQVGAAKAVKASVLATLVAKKQCEDCNRYCSACAAKQMDKDVDEARSALLEVQKAVSACIRAMRRRDGELRSRGRRERVRGGHKRKRSLSRGDTGRRLRQRREF